MDLSPPRMPENSPASSLRSTMETIKFEQPAAFSFSQVVHHQQDSLPDYVPVRTDGHITIKAAGGPASQKGIWVETEVHSHDPSLVHIISSEAGIIIRTPSTGPRAQVSINVGVQSETPADDKKGKKVMMMKGKSFKMVYSDNEVSPEEKKARLPRYAHDDGQNIFIKSTIYISRNLPLTSFSLSTSSRLSITIASGTPLHPQTPIQISGPSSPLTFSTHTPFSALTIDALSTTLTSTSSIHGAFTLRDALSLHTTSGSIAITLTLLPSSHNSAAPATLDAQSSSGSIAIRTTTLREIPKRDYRSSISTSSGSITTSLVHGTRTTLRSTSGRVDANLYPHGNTTLHSNIVVDTQSGSQDIVVHPSFTDATAPLRDFSADFRAASGSMRLAYPGQWEGEVWGTTVSGSIAVAWPGLRLVRDERRPGAHALQGVKGEGKGILAFRAVSGSVDLRGAAAAAAGNEGQCRGEEEGGGGGGPSLLLQNTRAPFRFEVAIRKCKEAYRRHSTGGVRVGDGVDVNESGTETETETDTLVGDGDQVVLTPSSEAGDEWLEVQ
ncbi:MAG: hypothetical protein Q9210_002158 [Variospora velana]